MVVGRPYRKQIEEIPSTVAWAGGLEVGDLRESLLHFAGKDLIAVGSGGSHAAAIFAAQLHEATLGGTGKGLTPLEALSRPASPNTVVLLLSGRGNNPDILRSFEVLSGRAYMEVAALCATRGSPLSRLMSEHGHFVFEFQPPGGRDGFLATKSLVATLVILARAYASVVDQVLPEMSTGEPARQWFDSELMKVVASRDTIFALTEGWGATAAQDFESRFTEASLSNVSVTDYRNFGHGRHHWFDRRRLSSAIVSFETPKAQRLASKTLSLLPDAIPTLRVQSPHDGPMGAIELVCASLELGLVAGNVHGVDPGRPTIADFGRRLYRGFPAMPPKNVSTGWIERKAAALGIPPTSNRNILENALETYLQRLASAHIRGLAVDYDGTLCSPSNRFLGMDTSIQIELRRILSHNIPLAIATGRGKSAHSQLRDAIPVEFWHQVILGLYNGGAILTLDQDIEAQQTLDSDLRTVESPLRQLSQIIPIQVSPKSQQISIHVPPGFSLPTVRNAIEETIKPIAPSLQVRASSHSIDVLPNHISKGLLVNALSNTLAAPVGVDDIVRIGDRGSIVGNDFELLNAGLSLSCGEVSADLKACWNLAPGGAVGTSATLAYLRALSCDASGTARFNVSQIVKGK